MFKISFMSSSYSLFILSLLLTGILNSGFAAEFSKDTNNVYMFDFGTDKSPLENGFVRMTPDIIFDKNINWGWQSTPKLTGVDYPVSPEPFPPVIYTTDLRQDSVQSTQPAKFYMKVPPGDYKIWAMVGTGGGGWEQVWDVTIQNPVTKDESSATFAGGDTARVLEIDASTNKKGILELDIKTRSKWSINGLVVVPTDKWPAIKEKIIDRLERSIQLLPEDILENWKHTPHREEIPRIEYTPSEKKRGFVIYRRPWVTPVWPDSRPYREQCDPTLETFMAQGEYEPLTFTILPLRDFKSAEVSIASLRSDSGNVIPSSDIDVRYVEYKFGRPDYKILGSYYRVPDILRPFNSPLALQGNENLRVWVTVHTTKDTPAGLYKGEINVMLDGKPMQTVPIAIKVLPIHLMKDSSITYSTYYRHPMRYLNDAPDEFSRQWWQAKIQSDMSSMVAHGYNSFRASISVSATRDGEIKVDFSALLQQFDIARKHGMDIDRPAMGDIRSCVKSLYKQYMGKSYQSHLFGVQIPPKRFFDQITEVVRKVESERRKQNLPELVYSLIDEPNASAKPLEFTSLVYQAAKKVPGIRTYITADPARKEYQILREFIDIWAVHHFAGPGVDQKKLIKKGAEIWCYPNYSAGENDHTPVAGARMTYGFARWKSGCTTLIPWIFESWNGDPENYLDSVQSDMFNHTSDDASVLPCTLYEAYREGIDDNRYITTLEYLIQKARKQGLNKQADEAQADLDFLLSAVPVAQEYQYDTGWSDENFDNLRLMLAKRILKLQAELKK